MGYGKDLAFVHEAGFGGFARSAIPVVEELLEGQGEEGGLVVDLGCGSGILTRVALDAGCEALGIDISPEMIALARKHAPGAELRVGSLLTTEIPPCRAVLCVGECLNYLFDRGAGVPGMKKLFRKAHRALEPGGFFLFDVALPGRGEKAPKRKHFQDEDWACLSEIEEDPVRQRLTRRITTFRRVGKTFRRDREVHRLRLFPKATITETLRSIGFRVRTLHGYGDLPFPPALAGFVARKPR